MNGCKMLVNEYWKKAHYELYDFCAAYNYSNGAPFLKQYRRLRDWNG